MLATQRDFFVEHSLRLDLQQVTTARDVRQISARQALEDRPNEFGRKSRTSSYRLYSDSCISHGRGVTGMLTFMLRPGL